jgi:beta-glucosidase
MTSYNLINGTHTACHKGLIEDVLRAEFGFDGLVMTDWLVRVAMGGGKYPLPEPFEIAAAGGDVLMPGSKAEYKALLKALKDKKISRRQLEINASRIIKTALRR